MAGWGTSSLASAAYRFSKRKWGKIAEPEAGSNCGERAHGTPALAPALAPLTLTPYSGLTAWFAAREAGGPLFHTLGKQQPFLVPSIQQEGLKRCPEVWGTGSTWQEAASASLASCQPQSRAVTCPQPGPLTWRPRPRKLVI